MRKPNFFIVGAPKCGTTAMNSYLSAHPDIFMGKKEQHFFGSDLRPPDYQGPHTVDIDWYLNFFKDVTTEKRAGEASVWYLRSKHAATELKAFAPEADIIIMLRNPVEMMYSLYNMFIWIRDLTPGGVIDAKTMKPLSFEEALQTQEPRKTLFEDTIDEEMRVGRKERRLFHTDAAMYADQVQRYLDVFGHEHVHIILYDDLKADTKKTYSEALAFLGVDPSFTTSFETVNVNKQIRSARLNWFLRTKKKKDAVGPLRQVVRLFVPSAARKKVGRLLMRANVREQARPPMKAETHQWLAATFRPDVERLNAILSQDLVTRWLP